MEARARYEHVEELAEELAARSSVRSVAAEKAGPARTKRLAFAAVAGAAAVLLGVVVVYRPADKSRQLIPKEQELSLELKLDTVRESKVDEAPKKATDKAPISLKALFSQMPEGKQPKLWCHGAKPPAIWEPDVAGKPLEVKILSYNLFWWNLYGKRGGAGNSAGNLITGSQADGKYDVMGFQECTDPWRVLRPVGLMNWFNALKGPYQTCVAYRKAAWNLLGHGMEDVAEDLPHNFYGRRAALWVRLEHKATKKTLFFLNHHGPLSINSGGLCGGQATAHKLVKLIQKKGKKGDTVVIVGDFNANVASLTISELRKYFIHAYNGMVFGGIDNFFTNLNVSSIAKTRQLGHGGSDHNALSIVLNISRSVNLKGSAGKHAYQAIWDRPFKALSDNGWDNKHFFCAVMENNVGYVNKTAGEWTLMGVKKPDKCCKLCQRDHNCNSWTFFEGGRCVLRNGHPTQRKWHFGVVSGIPYYKNWS